MTTQTVCHAILKATIKTEDGMCTRTVAQGRSNSPIKHKKNALATI